MGSANIQLCWWSCCTKSRLDPPSPVPVLTGSSGVWVWPCLREGLGHGARLGSVSCISGCCQRDAQGTFVNPQFPNPPIPLHAGSVKSELSCAGKGIASPRLSQGSWWERHLQSRLCCTVGIYRGSAGLLGRALSKQAPGASPAPESPRAAGTKETLAEGERGQRAFSQGHLWQGRSRGGHSGMSRRHFPMGPGPHSRAGSHQPLAERGVGDAG